MVFNDSAIISFLKYTKMPLPFEFLSRRQDEEKPSITNCEVGKDSPIFVSKIIGTSIFQAI